MDIMQFFCIAVIAIVTAIFIGWKIKKNGLKDTAIDLILLAEDNFKKGQNSEKMNFVCKEIRKILEKTMFGKLISIFITEQNLIDFIQAIFNGIKKALDYQKKS